MQPKRRQLYGSRVRFVILAAATGLGTYVIVARLISSPCTRRAIWETSSTCLVSTVNFAALLAGAVVGYATLRIGFRRRR